MAAKRSSAPSDERSLLGRAEVIAAAAEELGMTAIIGDGARGS